MSVWKQLLISGAVGLVVGVLVIAGTVALINHYGLTV